MNYLMERDTAAHDLAEVRKLIDSMNSLVNQQQQQQQKQQQEYQLKQQQQQQQQKQHAQTVSSATINPSNEYPCKQTPTSTGATQSPQTQTLPSSPTATTTTQQQQQTPTSNKLPPFTQDNAAAFLAAMAAAAAASQQQQQQNAQSPSTNTPADSKTNSSTQNQLNQQQQQQTQQVALPANGIVIEVNHLFFDKTLYFQLSLDATIEPLVTWLRLSFNDSSVSGMVLQYKGADGLWKCLLNRDDSLKRVLNQSFKSNTTLLQMRVPREQDLLSSGYTDRRLLALTKPSV